MTSLLSHWDLSGMLAMLEHIKDMSVTYATIYSFHSGKQCHAKDWGAEQVTLPLDKLFTMLNTPLSFFHIRFSCASCVSTKSAVLHFVKLMSVLHNSQALLASKKSLLCHKVTTSALRS